ncbi:MAG: cyclopentanol dehydrogenase [SAR202 cluster bacterium Io17-Chloro-G4]|nr:MAG: cyclopentanol dehydrogenase [SAR202 cluster bacterium Io17-Chloro-G4]
MRLENKVALISGGARGMGAVEAKLFAKEGAKVVIADVLEDEGKQTEAEIIEAGGQCLSVKLDVTSEETWVQAVSATVTRFGKLDILVNNAGIFPLGNVEETTVEIWDRVMAINGKGVFLGTKAAIPEMRKAGGGSIINLSSVAGLIGSARAAAYGATKGAVRIFTKSTAVQYAKDGIRANSIHPGIIDTPMTAPTILTDESSRQAQMARTPLGRLGQSEDVAYGVLFLASDESSFMTGSELVIDGGLTAQ